MDESSSLYDSLLHSVCPKRKSPTLDRESPICLKDFYLMGFQKAARG